jgi:16S rRNA G966 N2-methylase RsmD
MVDYKSLIGIKDAVRKIPADVFEQELDNMAQQLSEVDYHYNHSEEVLRKAWKKLCAYKNTDNFTASQTRPGLELCEHFFPNFFTIVNSKGESFEGYWKPEYLGKVIKWNRSSHSTPYLSELRRGIYFCYGLTKNTMFRPHITKMIVDKYGAKVVLDPCCGWGGRMLGTVAAGAKYIGFEPNTETFAHLNELAEFLGIQDKVELHNIGAEHIPEFDIRCDLVLTSPPYFDTEIYCKEETQSITNFKSYDEWLNGWLKPVILAGINCLNDGGVSCWNVAPKMINDVAKIHNEVGYVYNDTFGLHSSARQANQNLAHDKKTTDATVCYKKQ